MKAALFGSEHVAKFLIESGREDVDRFRKEIIDNVTISGANVLHCAISGNLPGICFCHYRTSFKFVLIIKTFVLIGRWDWLICIFFL